VPEANTAVPARTFECGEPVTGSFTNSHEHGIRIIPGPAVVAPDGSAKVAVQVVSDEPVDVTAPLAPMVLVTRGGKVVAKSRPVDNTPAGVPAVQSWVATKYALSPQHPYPVTVQGEAAPCEGVSWASIWADPSAYQMTVVLSAQGLIWNTPGADQMLTAPVPFS
jgi:hypothetical protein